jgi:hypothetical protein
LREKNPSATTIYNVNVVSTATPMYPARFLLLLLFLSLTACQNNSGEPDTAIATPETATLAQGAPICYIIIFRVLLNPYHG